MGSEQKNPAVAFFDAQFQKQVSSADYVLNPFENAALPLLFGDVLDLGCGLGNLSVAAAKRGCRVKALDASPAAISDLARRAKAERLQITAEEAELRELDVTGQFDSVVCIGLLMFFPKDVARRNLVKLKTLVKPNGIAVVNVFIEGTTFLAMTGAGQYYLFAENELDECFAGWKQEYRKIESFDAPNQTVKRFCTLIARRPAVDRNR